MKVLENINIAKLSTFKIGGRARFFCEVKNEKEFLGAVRIAEKLKVPYKLVAGGSNVIFPDGILNCLLIKIKKLSSDPALKINGNKISVDAGVNLLACIKKVISRGLMGLENLSGIPGTVGGAIVGNAGAYGHSISEAVEKVEVWNPSLVPQRGTLEGKGKKLWLNQEDCQFGYRHSIFSAFGGKDQPHIILRAVLRLKKGNPADLKKISQKIIKTRNKKYKPGIYCAGSFFKNVLVKDVSGNTLKLIDKNKIIERKIPAGYLLEQAGAKNMKIGGIRVADFHANALINSGKGTAKEVKKLAQILKNRVKKKFGILLEEEVRYF